MESGHLFFDPSACHGNMFLGNGDSLFQGARSMVGVDGTSKRRPFFSSPEDLFDDSYYDDQLPDKKRRPSAEQVHMLEKSFEEENKLEPERKSELAKKLGMQPRQVAVWFQNRRARSKTKQLERDYDLLKSSYDALLSNYDCILKENYKLKSEVVSLNKKLEAEENREENSDKKAEPFAQPTEMITNVECGLQLSNSNNRTEDRVSCRSNGTGSAVVDEDGTQLLMDSGDSYFGCMGLVDTVKLEEDGGSDDGRSYFSDVLVVQPDHEEPLGWWVWS